MTGQSESNLSAPVKRSSSVARDLVAGLVVFLVRSPFVFRDRSCLGCTTYVGGDLWHHRWSGCRHDSVVRVPVSVALLLDWRPLWLRN